MAIAPIPYPTPSFLRPQVGTPANGLLGLLGVQSNPFLDLLHNNSNTLIGLGAGIAGGGPDLGQAVGQGLTLAGQGKTADFNRNEKAKADALAAKQLQAAQAWTQANAPQYAGLLANGMLAPQDIGKLMTAGSTAQNDPADVATYKFYANEELKAGRSPKPFAEWFAGSKQAAKSGLGQPVPLKNRKTGEYVPFEPMSDGTMVNTLTGEKANGTDWMFDPGMIASDKAAGGAYGQAQGGAQFNLPAAKQNIDLELANIDAIANDQTGLDQTFGNLGGVSVGGIGIPNQWTPMLPNTPRADLKARIDQVIGQNFLQAYASLKGAGAITEVEGGKAQEAMARLSSAQSKESFLQALSDLKAVLKIGYDRMSQQATSGPYQSSGFTPAPLGDGATTDDLVKKYLGQ